MSTRTTLRPHLVINARSMATSLTSEATILQSLTKVSYAFSWSGSTPVGTVSLQVSNDYALDPGGKVKNAGTWTTLPLSDDTGAIVTSLPVAGNTGTIFIEAETSAYACRVIYTRGSGTGTMSATVSGKVS